MRTTFALLFAITLASCTDAASVPLEPHIPDPPDVYTGHDAYHRVVSDLRRELANPVVLDLAAGMTGQTVEQRRRHVEKLIAKFERLISEYDASAAMASSSSRCAKNPLMNGAAITFIDRPPLFDDFGALVTVKAFTSSTGGAILGNDLWVVHGREWPVEGAPPTGEWEQSESYESLHCVTAIYRPEITFDPMFRPGYVWAHNIHRVTNYWTGAEETRATEGLIFIGKKKVIDPPIG